ncbi:MAG: hypothetical protein K2K98_00600 [Muribaculaceae bacterium]|nr:hypothetical protein [Muribaculaceae bacterium]
MVKNIEAFDDITDDGRLWAVKYDGDKDNILDLLFAQWDDVIWLRSFFKENINDLQNYFKISDVDIAIDITAEDNDILQRKILDISPDANLDELFRPLHNYQSKELLLNKEKANPKTLTKHKSWLRIYALKLEDGCYIITGGAIKLTKTMQEREHTLEELLRQEKVRNFLLENKIIDTGSFIEYLTETN